MYIFSSTFFKKNLSSIFKDLSEMFPFTLLTISVSVTAPQGSVGLLYFFINLLNPSIFKIIYNSAVRN